METLNDPSLLSPINEKPKIPLQGWSEIQLGVKYPSDKAMINFRRALTNTRATRYMWPIKLMLIKIFLK